MKVGTCVLKIYGTCVFLLLSLEFMKKLIKACIFKMDTPSPPFPEEEHSRIRETHDVVFV